MLISKIGEDYIIYSKINITPTNICNASSYRSE